MEKKSKKAKRECSFIRELMLHFFFKKGFLNFRNRNGRRRLDLKKGTDYVWKLLGLIRLRTFEPRQKDIDLFSSRGFVSAW